MIHWLIGCNWRKPSSTWCGRCTARWFRLFTKGGDQAPQNAETARPVVACVGGVISNVDGAQPRILIPPSLWRKVEAEAKRRGGMFEGRLVAEVLDDWIMQLIDDSEDGS